MPMSLFKRKGPTPVEIARENDIKQNITAELSTAVKRLQQEQQLNSDEPIRSSDSANAVCNLLESIFLHGCKPPVSTKNFWLLCERFTHGDVVAQLKQLTQINSEIGLCRAWIRVALNDGLMESYVNALIADKRSLEYFYSTTSYLRDHEQPGIFLSYLKGLMSYDFQLSFNSSVLNKWPNASMVLAGLIDPDSTPLPVVHPLRATSKTAEIAQKDQNVASLNPVSRPRVQGKKRTSIEDRGLSPLPKGWSVSEYSSELTQEDVNQMRGMTPRNKTRSECSNSSLASCPDSVKYNKHPASYVADQENIGEPMFVIGDDVLCEDIQNRNSGSVENERHPDTDYIDQRSPNDNPSVDSEQNSPSKLSVNDPSSYGELSYSSLSGEILSSKDLEKNDACGPKVQESIVPARLMDGLVDKCDHCVVESKNTGGTFEKAVPVFISKNGTASSRVSPQQQDFVNERILQDILNTELDSPSDKKSNVTSDSSYNSKHSSPDDKKIKRKSRMKRKDLMPNFRWNSQRSAQIPAQMSPARADVIYTTGGRLVLPREDRNDEVPTSPRRPRSGAMSMCEEPEDDGGVGMASPPSTGNSLGARGGWSSDFDHPQLTAAAELPVREKSESFSALLRNYTPSSYVVSPTMEEILRELSDDTPSPPQVDPTLPTPQEEEYEIVGDVDSGNSDRNSPHQASMLGVIATEKGLDAQNYQCGSCKRPVGFIYGKPRVCTFDGKYYCFECHENDRYYIPAFILHNWDFRKHIVSKKSLAFLQDVEDHSVIDISAVNPKLYEHIKEMDQLQVLRRQLCHLKTYLFTCKQSIADEFRKSMWPKEYLYESTHTYTLADLLQVPSGQFMQSLKKSIKFATKHVYGCHLCSSKGFICELCNNPKVIYPFQTEDTIRCPKCKSVFHKSCKTDSVSCPKCTRRSKRVSQNGETLETPDIHDYAFIPQFSD
ncbi:uncharacterized protein LOC125664377 isoform X3 [Ostrea edulis]|uniref:uncharacterized protein LOC125664377 isoform X3 n=1 Tax=Ostrea edulis TaxID=37623 RepID=UPI0024AE8A53|nr:uncharacterized protein LOC125664377 isoform X3 [Ostrea edulis]